MNSTLLFSVADKTLNSNDIDRHLELESIISDIKTDKYHDVINKIRIASDKETRTALKKEKLPIFYPSVCLSNYKTLDDNDYYNSTGESFNLTISL